MVSLSWRGSAVLTEEGYNPVPVEEPTSSIEKEDKDCERLREVEEAQSRLLETEAEVEVLKAQIQEAQKVLQEKEEAVERLKEESISLEQEIENLVQQENEVQQELDLLDRNWTHLKDMKQKELEELQHLKEQKQTQLEAQNVVNEDVVLDPPGPECLLWVRGTTFTTICSAVVIVNLITMGMEIVHPRYKQEFFFLDQAVMVFYVTELALKALLYQRDLLIGSCSIVWWNWLDMIIVIVGIFDGWIRPFVMVKSGKHGGHQSTAVQIIKMLRLARLARILKTVRVFLQSDLAWTEGKEFQLFIMGTIAANSLIMSFESDFPDFWGWFYVEQILLVIFSFELLVRLRYSGCMFFCNPSDLAWNWLDFIIVCGGIVDQWLMPCVSIVQELMGMKSGQAFDVGEIMTTLRMARLLRVLRLVRLIKNIPPLFTLIVGIIQAMQGMAWVLVLTCVFLYAFALLSVRLVGHGLLFGGQAPEEVAAIFPTVPQSMFVLFKVMNGDTEPVEPLFHALPISKLVFVLYMVVSSWAILSILTAVVSDNMINATDAHREEENKESEEAELKLMDLRLHDRLNDIFSKMDTDKSGDLGENEFKQIMDDPELLEIVMKETELDKGDLEQLYAKMMSGDKVDRKTFIDAVTAETAAKRPAFERCVMRVERYVSELREESQTRIESRLESLMTGIEETLEKQRQAIESMVGNRSSDPDRRPGESTIEQSLAKIEEHMDISKELLDRSRAECTIVSCLSKIEKQNFDIKKELFERVKAESTIKASLAKIEERLDIGKESVWLDITHDLSSLESVLHRIEKRIGAIPDEHLTNYQQVHANFVGKVGGPHVHDQGPVLPTVPMHDPLHGLGHDTRADMKAHDISAGTPGVGLWAAHDSN